MNAPAAAAGLRVLVTRPAVQAAEWVERLRAAGLDAVPLPLIDIAPPSSPEAVEAAWRDLPAQRLVVFVSPNAAERFMALRPAGADWPAGVRAASIGPGTTRTLRRLGVPAAALVEPATEAPQFDSEALWARLADADWRGARVLLVRGDGGRAWLADTLAAAGAEVAFVGAYRRLAPTLDGAARRTLAAALAAPGRHLWFFSSSEAIDHLADLVEAGTDWSHARALATHPRIAARARALGIGQVHDARPTPAAVVACILSIAL